MRKLSFVQLAIAAILGIIAIGLSVFFTVDPDTTAEESKNHDENEFTHGIEYSATLSEYDAEQLVRSIPEVERFFEEQAERDTTPGLVVLPIEGKPYYEVVITSFNEAQTLRVTFATYWVNMVTGEISEEQPF